MSILGNRVQRVEDERMLTVGGTYVDDLEFADALWVTFVRSPIAHARITGIDTATAAAQPGVRAAFTGADVELAPIPPPFPMIAPEMVRSWLATDVVRFVGEPVAVIVSTTRDGGFDAAEAVEVDYEPLDPVVAPRDAEADRVLLFPDAGTNVAWRMNGRGQAEGPAEVVVEAELVNQRLAPAPLEPRAAVARWSEDQLEMWFSTQGVFRCRDDLVEAYGLDPEAVRVRCPDVGGGFGAKGSPGPEELLLPWIARRVRTPVRWCETRTESMLNLGTGRGQVQRIRLGGRRDGTIESYRLSVLQDAGAYPRMGALMPVPTKTMTTGVYAIGVADFDAAVVMTNTSPGVAYRGAGRPEAAAALERAVDLFAAEIGIDPLEVRRRNLVAADAFPYRTAIGTTYDSGDYRGVLDQLAEVADYPALRAEQARRRDAGDACLMGIGVAMYVEVTAGASGADIARIELQPGPRAVVTLGSAPQGQGHATTWSMLVADGLGLEMSSVEVRFGDTALTEMGAVTGGSRSVQIVGSAVAGAAAKVLELARQRAAELLEADVADVIWNEDERQFSVAGTPAIGVAWSQLIDDAVPPLSAEHIFEPAGPTFPFGAHLAVVEIDPETGQIELVRFVACDDAGVIVNPAGADGQIHGGLAQGIAQALIEEFRYDADGNPLTTNFADYPVISAAELPSFERSPHVTPTPLNDLGAKGIGESGTIGSTPAVQNAVLDALAPLGIRHIDLPLTPERVWQAIRAATARL